MTNRTGAPLNSDSEWFDACRRLGTDAELIWKHYDHLERLETRYASQMERLRLLASTWLIGTFAAVGFVLFKEPNSAGSLFVANPSIGLVGEHFLAPEWVAFFIFSIGTLGTFLLWSLDALVYRPLLAATFWEAIQLERTTSFVIPIRQQLSRLSRTFGKGVAGLVSCYYLVIISVQLVATSLLLAHALRGIILYGFVSLLIHAGLTLCLLAILFLAQAKLAATRNWTNLERRTLSEGQ